MKILRNELKNDFKVRLEMNFPKEGIEFIDITPLMLDNNIFNEITDLFSKEVENKNVDYILCPEARGFIFGTAVACKLNKGIIPVRKKGKLSPSTVEATFEYEKEYGKDYLELPKLLNDSYKGKNFYVIDDIYATGNTIKAIIDEINKLGGNVVGYASVINIKELNDDPNVYSIVDINEG